jgi:uncharacterized coiled-coil protein SlyX
MKLPKIIASLEAIHEETQSDLDSILNHVKSICRMQDKINDLVKLLDAAQGTNEAEGEPSENTPHWEEAPQQNIIIKTCSTCGVQKYE